MDIKRILKNTRYISKPLKLAFSLILVVFVLNMFCPQTVLAQSFWAKAEDIQAGLVIERADRPDLLTQKFLASNVRVTRTIVVMATAYSSEVAQTDSTPCITANGFNVCNHGEEDIIAANFLPLGTAVRIPDLYGDKVLTVQDRMNPRYDYRIDLWKTSYDRAMDFGKKRLKIEVLD